MIAIDTNVVVRFLANDHYQQASKARALIEQNRIFVTLTVLLEAEWVLRSDYGFSPTALVTAFRAFAGLPNIVVQDPSALAKALEWMDAGMDFADALHLAQMGASEAFATFDVRLVKIAKQVQAAEIWEPDAR
ncbi:type II toxin-antitoxin system VapC family toxin [Methylocystis sp. S23]